MGTTRKTITLTDKQDQWIKAQIAAGEYIRDLVRRDQEENAKFMALKQAIQEAVNDEGSDVVLARAGCRRRADRNTPHLQIGGRGKDRTQTCPLDGLLVAPDGSIGTLPAISPAKGRS